MTHAICQDCGRDTTPDELAGWEWYLVRDELWAEAGNPSGFLCVGCLERRLGRALRPDDFSDAPVNDANSVDSGRLSARRSGRIPGC